ncbi:putative molybdenum cofactor biosynthesis protein D2 (MoaD2) / thiamineS [Gordonia spumicola]|uniref:Putative molybdenum cofactor biosynthesis protein D2 (MoaD2) / thiamineS n=1 Tax=Gordonia spumicola TaxID=589161 RepID=A0A7I9V4K0_9ACTN|nr:MoaD/ThiS family protein [Gordonia spumicola]GED99930.1 putative molybdenum cofactor biosynthesis protein D2 (MoaD2) / thiamineS [Gordonia spumicola]
MIVRFFAGAAEAAGRTEQTVDGGVSVAVLKSALVDQHGAEFARVLGYCSLLVDGVLAKDATVASPNSTVDVLPPFAGG